VRIFGLAALFCGATFGQSEGPAKAPIAFEVASIKPAALRGASGCGYRMEGGPGTSDPGRVAYHNISLSTLVKLAYLGNVHACENYVLSAPTWLDSKGFEIIAILPPGTTRALLGLMLQSLLAERFKLQVHREAKVVPSCALVVAKSGPKFKESVEDPAANDAKDNAATSPQAGPSKMTIDKDGFPVLAINGSWMTTINGHNRLRQLRADVRTLARQLQKQLGRPVADATGLKGTYDFTLSWVAEPLVTSDSDSALDIFTAVQQQFGLRLEASKETIEVLAVDHVEKVPIEN